MASKTELIRKIISLPRGADDVPVAPPIELVGAVICIARNATNWKQSALADLAGVSLSTVERLERGEPISLDNIDKIGEALGYEKGYFTEPRCKRTEAQIDKYYRVNYGHTEAVEVRPLVSHAQVRRLALCQAFLPLQREVPDELQSKLFTLLEWIDLVAFVSGSTHASHAKEKRRELYNAVLEEVARLRRVGLYLRVGTMDAPQTGFPDWKVAIFLVVQKERDPGGAKAKTIFVDRRLADLEQNRANVGASKDALS